MDPFKFSSLFLYGNFNIFLSTSAYEYLKVMVHANDNPKGSRRRLRVLKLLEQESIAWVEGDTADTILIRLSNIDPKSLSFVKTL